MSVLTTINKTIFSYLFAIVGAEYISGIIPKGTHQWDKFVSPEELEAILKREGFGSVQKKGMFYNVMSGQWWHVDDLSVNYCICGIKESEK